MIPPEESFDGTFPFKPHFSTAPGFRMHYVDEGEGDVILLLHGEPSWSYLFRMVIPPLAKRYRVIAPDFMGFGKSDTPQDGKYTTKGHIDNIEKLVIDLDLHNITAVLHDWGGTIGGGVIFRHCDRFKRVVITNSLLCLGLPEEAIVGKCFTEVEYFQWMARLHEAGVLETVLGQFKVIILSVMKHLQGFEKSSNINETWLKAYSMPFETPEECIGAINFPKSIVTDTMDLPHPDEVTVAKIRSMPALGIFGMQDKVLPAKYTIPCFQSAFPNAPVHRLEKAGHFLYEDEPECIAALIDQFVQLS